MKNYMKGVVVLAAVILMIGLMGCSEEATSPVGSSGGAQDLASFGAGMSVDVDDLGVEPWKPGIQYVIGWGALPTTLRCTCSAYRQPAIICSNT